MTRYSKNWGETWSPDYAYAPDQNIHDFDLWQ